MSDFVQDIMGAKLKEIIRINKAKCLPIKVFFHICTFVKRALKGQYCGNGMLYFAGAGQSRVSGRRNGCVKTPFSWPLRACRTGLPDAGRIPGGAAPTIALCVHVSYKSQGRMVCIKPSLVSIFSLSCGSFLRSTRKLVRAAISLKI